jgi:hypothetical protein
MKKEEFIKRWGVEAYERRMKQSRDWRDAHPENYEKWRKQIADWRYFNFKKVREYAQKTKHKYRVRNVIRAKHSKIYQKYRHIIAQGTRLCYLWIPKTDEYKCIALVETDQLQYPFKDVINKASFRKGKYHRFLMRKRSVPTFTEEELQAGLTE